MRTQRSIPPAVVASVLLGIGFFLSLGSLVGCSADRTVAPGQTWEEVRYHWSEGQEGATYGDLTILSSGEMVWELQGQGASIRGLLAGENLETLTRLIDALPPADYENSGSCDRRYFLTLTTPEGRRSYATGGCDAAVPIGLKGLAAHLDSLVVDEGQYSADAVGFRILAQGSHSRLSTESRRIARNRDELLSLIDLTGGEGIGVIPAIDFKHQVVVGIFLGSRPTEGYAVSVTGAYETLQNQIVLREMRIVPDPACLEGASSSSPYVMVLVDGGGNEDILSQIDTVIRPCGTR